MADNTKTKKNGAVDVEEVRPVVITDTETGEKYVLEFNAESVKFAEERNFKTDDVFQKAVSTIPEFFYYAFRMHHKYLPKDKVMRIYNELLPLPEGLIKRLLELYYIPLEGILGTKENGNEPKNSRMTVEL